MKKLSGVVFAFLFMLTLSGLNAYAIVDVPPANTIQRVLNFSNDFALFKKLVKNTNKTVVLVSENYYNTLKNKNLGLPIVSVNPKNLDSVLKTVSTNYDSALVTPLFNLTAEQRKYLYSNLADKKIPTFSLMGEDDVKSGALLGTSNSNAYKQFNDLTAFNTYDYLHTNIVKNEVIDFYDEDVIFYNKDIGEKIGYVAPLRLLNNCKIISSKPALKYDLSYVFNRLNESNLDIKQKKFLVDAARRATISSYLKYLPTLRLDLGYNTYNSEYAKSYSDVPSRLGLFTVGMDQMLYSPDLVTNILIKHKQLKFDKAEKILTEQNVALEVAYLYLDVLMLENMIEAQKGFVREEQIGLALSKKREKAGYSGKEELLQWAGRISDAQQILLSMETDYKNVKINVNKLLNKDQKEDYTFASLTADSPAFLTSELNISEQVTTPKQLEKFTDMLVKEAIYLSPETAKLKAAIAMKKAEMSNYVQKFFLPDAMLTLEHSTTFGADFPYGDYLTGEMRSLRRAYGDGGYNVLDDNSTRLMIAAQWRPIEGGQKFAEIARCKSELNQLNAYLEDVNNEIEMNVRSAVNRALSKYFIIEKTYKKMVVETESYESLKKKYLNGEVTIAQITMVSDMSASATLESVNARYEFLKELLYIQRQLVSVNWENASQYAKDWLTNISGILSVQSNASL